MAATDVKTALTIKGVKNFTVNPNSIGANSTGQFTVSWTGVSVEDFPLVRMPSLETGLVVSHAWVSSTGTITVRLANVTAGAIDPAPQSCQIILL
ncbi:MAG: hypothetical protein V2G41_09550 [bacterium JZ-2024 1]